MFKTGLLIVVGIMNKQKQPGNPFSWQKGMHTHPTFSLSVRAALLWLADLIEYEGPL
jgi:hypothetical protein